MPGIVTGTERAAYYTALAEALGLVIDPIGPSFGIESLLDAIADSPALATFAGEQTRLVWPHHYDLRRVPVRDPVPAYPHWLVWRADNPHPALAAFRAYLADARPARVAERVWTPSWAR